MRKNRFEDAIKIFQLSRTIDSKTLLQFQVPIHLLENVATK